MKRLLLILGVFLLFASKARSQGATVIQFDGVNIYYNTNTGQVQQAQVVPFNLGGNNPAGSCFTSEFAYNIAGSIYLCISNRWVLASSGASFPNLTDSSGTLTYVGSGGILATLGPIVGGSDGVHAGYVSFQGQTGPPTIPLNSVAWVAPASASFTQYGLQFPSTAPANATPLLSCTTPSSNLSACSWVAGVSGAIVQAPAASATNTITSPSGVVPLSIIGSGTGDTFDFGTTTSHTYFNMDGNGNVNLNSAFITVSASSLFQFFNGSSSSPSLSANTPGLLDIGTGASVGQETGFVKGAMTVTLASDWTCGTGGTVSSCVSAATIGTLTMALPHKAIDWVIDCEGAVGQATGATANNWAVQTATNGAANTEADYMMNTAATAMTGGSLTGSASGTTSVSITPTWTLGGTATQMPWRVHTTLHNVSASGTTFNLQLVAPTVGDLVTVFAGAACHAS